MPVPTILTTPLLWLGIEMRVGHGGTQGRQYSLRSGLL